MDTSKTNNEDQVEDKTVQEEITEKKVTETQEESTQESELTTKDSEPEVIVENFEEKDKEAKTGFFADLNATPDSMTKWLGIVGGVLAVAFIAIFSIDMFMGKDDPSKSLDVSKKQTQVTPVQQQKQQELPMPEVYGTKEGDANTSGTTTSTKPTATKIPTPTTAPTSAPEPTATKAPDPTAAPTSTPAPTTAPTNTPEPSPTTSN